MTTKLLEPQAGLTRHRIKTIELHPNKSKYHINLKVFVDDKEVYKLPRIEHGENLKWSIPIICRNISHRSKVTLEVSEKHTLRHEYHKSQAYEISNVQALTEITLVFPGTEWAAKITPLVPETVDQSYTSALRHLKQTRLPPSVRDTAGHTQHLFEAILDFSNVVAEVYPPAKMIFSVCPDVWDKLRVDPHLRQDTQALLEALSGFGDLAELAKKRTHLEPLRNVIEGIIVLFEDIFLYVRDQELRRNDVFHVFHDLLDSDGQHTANEFLDRFKILRAKFVSEIEADTQIIEPELVLPDSLHLPNSLDLPDLPATRIDLGGLSIVNRSGYDLDQACLKGTREGIITEVLAWAQRPTDAPERQHMLWIHGQAGTGKSAIANSICGRLADNQLLAASFFCKRDGPELRDPLGVINTIANGLASQNQSYRQAVAAAIQDNPGLCVAPTIHSRYQGLIKTSMQGLEDLPTPQPLVVLVDALDECGTTETRCDLIEHLYDLSQLVPWLKVIITSRPEENIKETFQKLSNSHISSCDVHNFDASGDIHTYFKKELGEFSRIHEWPAGSIERLCDKTNGRFIWASIVARYIAGAADSTIEPLNAVLDNQKSNELDWLYAQVIRGVMNHGDENKEVFRQCIGSLVMVSSRHPLSLPELQDLSQGQAYHDSLEFVVRSLGAVLYGDEKMNGAIRFYDLGFVDYTTDPARSGEFYVELERRHMELAGGCLQTMLRGLKFNICGLETSDLFNSQILDLSERINAEIGRNLSYSCIYWIDHLKGSPEQNLLAEVNVLFNGSQVLYWLEVLSLLGRLDIASEGLLGLLKWLPDEAHGIRECACDLYRFILRFYDVISTSTPHLYVSALALAPESITIRRLKATFPNTVVVTTGVKDWPAWLRSLEHPMSIISLANAADGRQLITCCADGGIRQWDTRTGAQIDQPLFGYSKYATIVAISPNGKLVVSGSGNNLEMWNFKTQNEARVYFYGHSDTVISVAFSPDGKLIASGSDDAAVRLWDAQAHSGAGKPLVGHSSGIRTLSFSPDSKLVASGSDDHTIRLWDVATCSAVGDPLVGHSNWVRSVAFSPDGRLVVSGSDDNTLRLWDVATRAVIGEPLVGHSGWVMSAAFSPDSKFIVSGSSDMTVRLWDVNKRATVGEPLIGHSEFVTSAIFSCDGSIVASSSIDGTLRLWDVGTCTVTEEPLDEEPGQPTAIPGRVPSFLFPLRSNPLAAKTGSENKKTQAGKIIIRHNSYSRLRSSHSSPVTSIAFSPDGRVIVSGLENKTVQVWDVTSYSLLGQPLGGHTNGVTSVAFSPTGELLASGSEDSNIRLWDGKTRAAVGKPIFAHSETVTSLAFSPDGNHIVSASSDNAVRFWDIKTRAAVGKVLIGHSKGVTSIAFSPDGKTLASSSKDGTVQFWDVMTQTMVGKPLIVQSNYVIPTDISEDSVHTIGRSLDDFAHADGELSPFTPTATGLESPDTPYSSGRSQAFSERPLRRRGMASGLNNSSPGTQELPWEFAVSINCIAFSPDGSLVASGSDDHTMRFWNVETRTAVGEPLIAHSAPVNSLAFSRDGNFVVSGSSDHTMRLWDARTHTMVGESFIGHSSAVISVAFAPDGNRIISGSYDGTPPEYTVKSSEPKPLRLSLTTSALRPLSGYDGWVSLDQESSLLWLPAHYRQPYDPRAVYTFSTDPTHSVVALDLSNFAHGVGWSTVVGDKAESHVTQVV